MRPAAPPRGCSEEQVDELRESCDRFDALEPEDELRELVRENLFFHNTILEIAGSARLASMVRQVIELPLVYKSYIWYSPDQKRISVALPPADRECARERATPSAPSWS